MEIDHTVVDWRSAFQGLCANSDVYVAGGGGGNTGITWGHAGWKPAGSCGAAGGGRLPHQGLTTTNPEAGGARGSRSQIGATSCCAQGAKRGCDEPTRNVYLFCRVLGITLKTITTKPLRRSWLGALGQYTMCILRTSPRSPLLADQELVSKRTDGLALCSISQL